MLIYVDMIVRSYELKRRKKRSAHFRDYIIDRWNINRFSRRIDRGTSSNIRVIWAQNFSLLSNEARVDGYLGSVEIRISFFNVRLSGDRLFKEESDTCHNICHFNILRGTWNF